jgi:CHAD domain-containing protein
MTDAQPGTNGKWIEGLSADLALGKAARKALTARLEATRDALAPTANWGPDPEPVHHLRVTTRRARAALDVFGDLLPGRSRRRIRRTLKRLRRAAGEARDADVFLAAVRTWAVHQSPTDRPGLHFLVGHAFHRRQTAQTKLLDTMPRLQAAVDEFDDLTRKVHDEKKESLGDRAEIVLTALLDDLETAAGRNLDDYEQLHQVRIIAKRLRYAIELFVECFPQTVREQVYPRVEAVQDILGSANDSHQAVVLLDDMLRTVRETQPNLWDILRGGLEGMRAYHMQRERDQRIAFVDWWRQWQASRPESLFSDATGPPTEIVESPDRVGAAAAGK